MASYTITHLTRIDGYAVVQVLEDTEIEVGQDIVISSASDATFDGTHTVISTETYELIDITDEGDLVFDWDVYQPNQAIFVDAGDNVARDTATGTVTNDSGFPLAELNEAFAAHGADCVNELGEVGHSMAVFGAGADVVFAGSKVGIIDHKVAADLEHCAAVVPSGRLPLTARGLAVLRKAGVQTPADFVALAGSTLATWGDISRSDDEIVARVRDDIGSLCDELQGHDDGLLLAACYLAEAFLMEWQDELPWGRPLAP